MPDRYEDAARALRADRTLNHLAGVRRLELRALFALLVAIRMILIGNRLLRDLRPRRSGVWRRAADRQATGRIYRVLQKCAPAKRHRPRTHVTPQLSASEGRRFEPCDALQGVLFHAHIDDAPPGNDRYGINRALGKSLDSRSGCDRGGALRGRTRCHGRLVNGKVITP